MFLLTKVRALRARLVPQLVHALHHTLHETAVATERDEATPAPKFFRAALDVATLVADERHRLSRGVNALSQVFAVLQIITATTISLRASTTKSKNHVAS